MYEKLIACAFLFLCLLLSPIVWAQQQVTGKINDKDGTPIAGASISVKGTSRGTLTDANGQFSINASKGDVLVFRHIGYAEQEFAADKVPATILLTPRVADLDDIVVIGYGTQKKSVTTGAISRVKATDLENMPINRVEDALQGRASGVTIAANSGQPGSAATVRVRGITTLNNNNPLWVIDGTVVDNGGIGFLNQSDIESIEVLKDAASQAIYGARAAAGVILITTKKERSASLVLITMVFMVYRLQLKNWTCSMLLNMLRLETKRLSMPINRRLMPTLLHLVKARIGRSRSLTTVPKGKTMS
ncbi:TonB-dependent receptor plug domain-containing protein [Paraflavitalea speifideaquila]|uniref:TonB-dependent receptor plug domain-containing protein n=1 Tax=Paraflavitalea speifideaquila TaxID=3076558 RepID=UPI0028E7C069|nr:TonB-dependent receptor plug domain-containing protein [Paraflavitalea speifideiaquila]